MHEADRPAPGHAEPHVGRDRDRSAFARAIEADLDGEARDQLAALEHERPRDQIVGAGARVGRRRGDRESHEQAPHRATVAWAIALALGAPACRTQLDDLDGIFYDGDERAVHCAVNLDTSAGNSFADLDRALDRAAARGEVVELYAHRPTVTVTLETLEHVLAGAHERGLAFVTYADFAAGGVTGPGLALSFDDSGVRYWFLARPLFAQYAARVTFFVTRYDALSDDLRDSIRILADDGHDIEAHSLQHLRAPTYVEEHGLGAYLDDEALPSIEALRRVGYPVVAYAYPYGARTAELDRALLAHVPILRSVSFALDVATDPCPR